MELVKKDDYRWIVKKEGRMNTEGLIFTTEKMLEQLRRENAINQVANVACLPGIVGSSMAMPDIHSGYGFPIGGVAAFDLEKGVVSPGGIGYDINCGVRLLALACKKTDIEKHLDKLLAGLFNFVPSGVGSSGKKAFSAGEILKIMEEGALWAVKQGFGEKDDLTRTEDGGFIKGAFPEDVSEKAVSRGKNQVGSLGAGNHFLEIQEVTEIFNEKKASAFGLFPGQITVMLHTGSRGLGYQVCDDYIGLMKKASVRYGIYLPDGQLACAPVGSPEGKKYLSAMRCAANYAWANRQVIHFRIKEVFSDIVGKSLAESLKIVYDVAHNIGKIEEIDDGKSGKHKVLVHRKGATRAYPPGHQSLSECYLESGQPVIIPGTMGTSSYVLCGEPRSGIETFFSVCHGAGRRMSRSEALRKQTSSEVIGRMKASGILLMADKMKTVAEEAPEAYKDVDSVVEVCERAGLAVKVAKLKPLAVMKG